jgi:hypothetical protein
MIKAMNSKSQERSTILKKTEKSTEINLRNQKETGHTNKVLKLTYKSPNRVSFKSENLDDIINDYN